MTGCSLLERSESGLCSGSGSRRLSRGRKGSYSELDRSDSCRGKYLALLNDWAPYTQPCSTWNDGTRVCVCVYVCVCVCAKDQGRQRMQTCYR